MERLPTLMGQRKIILGQSLQYRSSKVSPGTGTLLVGSQKLGKHRMERDGNGGIPPGSTLLVVIRW